MSTPVPFCGILDVAHWESAGDVARAAREGGIALVIAKATQGKDGIDPAYRKFRDEVAAVPRLLFGHFHFGSNSEPGDLQNDWYRASSDPRALAVLDLERNPNPGGNMPIVEAERFVVRHHQATGVWPVLYSYSSLLHNAGISPTSPLANCPLWMAIYNLVIGNVPRPWLEVAMWQYRGGTVTPLPPGFPDATPRFGRADRSAFLLGDRTEAALRAWYASQLPAT